MAEILGVRIDSVSLVEVKERVGLWLKGSEQKKIFTPNPEMLVLAQKFPRFKEVLNGGDLNLCDGFGITLVSGGKIKRIPGSDFVWELCEMAEKDGKSIFLLGTGNDEVLLKTKEVLNTKFVQLKIARMDKGPKIEVVGGDMKVNGEENNEALRKINESGAEVLIVAFGQMKQEMWIEEFLPKLPGVKLTIGVGGALDYIGGKVKRAPRWVRKIGFEWLYRLIREPRRVKRIFTATFLFIYYIIKKYGRAKSCGRTF